MTHSKNSTPLAAKVGGARLLTMLFTLVTMTAGCMAETSWQDADELAGAYDEIGHADEELLAVDCQCAAGTTLDLPNRTIRCPNGEEGIQSCYFPCSTAAACDPGVKTVPLRPGTIDDRVIRTHITGMWAANPICIDTCPPTSEAGASNP